MARIVATLALLLFVAGCTGTQGEAYLGMPGSPMWFKTAAPQTIAAHFAAQCEAYGFRPGTDAMAQCIQQEAAARKQSNAIGMAALVQANAAQQAAARANRPTTTNCTRFGNNVNCTTF